MRIKWLGPVRRRVARTAEKYYSFPVVSITKSAGDDDDLIIVGKATDATLDHDMQVIDPAWSRQAITRWLNSGYPAVRMSHDSRRPIGKGISAHTDADGATWVRSLIAEPVSKSLVLKGVLRAYSLGIVNAHVRRDPTGRATGGIIDGGSVLELTVCDSPANPSCGITLAKAGSDGSAEFVGKVFGMKAGKPGKVEKALQRFSGDPEGFARWLAKRAQANREESLRAFLVETVNSTNNPLDRETARQELRRYGLG